MVAKTTVSEGLSNFQLALKRSKITDDINQNKKDF